MISKAKARTNTDYVNEWRTSLDQQELDWPKPKAMLTPLTLVGLSAREVILGLARLKSLLDDCNQRQLTLSLRTVSARCFNGRSKVLDNKRGFLDNAFPLARTVIEDRTIMLSAYIPKQLRTVLFIENFDSFKTVVAAIKSLDPCPSIAVVYSAGYRVSAEKIRQPQVSQFVTINQVSQRAYQQFYAWWYCQASSNQRAPSCWFWGDLDYEGVSILGALRRIFPSTKSWRQAYLRMLNFADSGIKYPHTNVERSLSASTARHGQPTPSFTGCEFADTVLLPRLQASRYFTDQEVLSRADVDAVLKTSLELFR